MYRVGRAASDLHAAAYAVGVVVALVFGVRFLREAGKIPAHLARKVLHISCGLVFILTWPMFGNSKQSAQYAAAVPAMITLYFALVGMGIINDSGVVSIMSRNGTRNDLLKGPVYYGIVHIASTLLFWKNSTGVMAIVILCAGDGFADIIGRKYGSKRLPWSKGKSWAGSAAFLIASYVVGLLYLNVCIQYGWTRLPMDWLQMKLAMMCAICTIVESLPIAEYDNLTVFAAAVLVDKLIFAEKSLSFL